ncbi:MAG: hypothetical protein KBT31_02730 [Firmicutes bacterium]|nr:hypothetical protein [Candidatus Colimorpha enterica]
MRIGMQLYTLRDYCKTTEDFAETLKKVADIGYKFVQVSGTCAYEAEWLKEQLDKNGLACPLTHYDQEKMINTPEATVSFHNVFGCKHIGLGGVHGFFGDLTAFDPFLPASSRRQRRSTTSDPW